ncbi:MAG: tRNA dihydrouridine(20/20a) synthase DusA [Pseudomonadota bacterium]
MSQPPHTPAARAVARLSVAPMMAWTDRHCRIFHRQFTAYTRLYTEMVTSAALVRGGALRLLDHDPAEHPLALQLGGSEPGELAQAARMAEEAGYAEVNLNVGCPSDRVQSGTFGAVLMKEPARVAACVAAMAAAVKIPVTVKCRIGVDDQEPAEVLPAFLETLQSTGLRQVTIHARKAWLKGLSPKENRDIPPLDYDLVYEMARAFPSLSLAINGGVESLEDAEAHLAHMAGVMVGRAAYHRPADLLMDADRRLFGAGRHRSREEVLDAMEPYIARHLEGGGSLHQVTRHMLGLYAGQPGARAWRRILSEGATREGAGLALLAQAREAVMGARADAAA